MKYDIASMAQEYPDFRKILWTGEKLQLVLMTIAAGDEIGLETHDLSDQILAIVDGAGSALVDGIESTFAKGDVIVVPAGSEHNIVNTGDSPLVLYTIYGPPVHEAEEVPEEGGEETEVPVEPEIPEEGGEELPEVPEEGTEEELPEEVDEEGVYVDNTLPHELPTEEVPEEELPYVDNELPETEFPVEEVPSEELPPTEEFPTEEMPDESGEELLPEQLPVFPEEGEEELFPEQLPTFPDEGEEPPVPTQLPYYPEEGEEEVLPEPTQLPYFPEETGEELIPSYGPDGERLVENDNGGGLEVRRNIGDNKGNRRGRGRRK